MAHGIHPLQGRLRHSRHPQVRPDQLRTLDDPRRVAVDNPHLVVPLLERLDHVRADEPPAAGDQHLHDDPDLGQTRAGDRGDRRHPPGARRECSPCPACWGPSPAGSGRSWWTTARPTVQGLLASSLGAVVVSEPRQGFGAACFAGLLRAESEVVCFMDCDGSLDGADLPKVVAPLLQGRADLVMGRRRAARGSWPLHARIANLVLGAALRARHHVRVRDLGPMRAAGREALLQLGIVDRRFGWPLEMVVRAADSGWRIVEVDVPYHSRQGRSKVTGTFKGTMRTVRDMAAVLR